MEEDEAPDDLEEFMSTCDPLWFDDEEEDEED